MTFDYDKFMKGVGLYEEANRRRDKLEFEFAFSLYERAQEFLANRLDVTLFYDMALAANLNGNLRKADSYLLKGQESLEQMRAENPNDSNIANLQNLIENLARQLELQKMADLNATNYADHVGHRVWTEDKFPLTIWIADIAINTAGFDNHVSNLIYDAFKKWVSNCQWFQIARANNSDESIAKIVIKQASAQDLQQGSAGQTNFSPQDSFMPNKVDIRLYIPSPKLSDLNSDQKRIFQSLVLHEAGHALGIDGHSPYADDLMWWKSPLTELSKRDVETLKVIYQK